MLRRLLLGVVCAALCGSGLGPAPATSQTPGKDSIVIAGGVDVVGLSGLDVITIVPDRMLMDHVSDTLLIRSRAGELKPHLVTHWENTSPLVWELKLRQDVKFQNGEPFNAAAVKFFYDMMNDPSLKSPAKGIHAWVAKTEVVDDYTVRITSREPFPTAPNQLTLAHMVPPKYVAEVGVDGYRRKPIGTGPYRLVELVRDTRAVFEASDGWWGGPQEIKRIMYRPIKEDSARVSALLAGEIDLAFDVPPELIPLVERARNAMIKRTLSVRAYMLWFNNLVPVISDLASQGARGDQLRGRPRQPEQEHAGRHRRADRLAEPEVVRGQSRAGTDPLRSGARQAIARGGRLSERLRRRSGFTARPLHQGQGDGGGHCRAIGQGRHSRHGQGLRVGRVHETDVEPPVEFL